MRNHAASQATLIVLALAGAFFLAPTAAEHNPLVNLSLGAQSEDFNGADGGYTTSVADPLPVSSWEWGAPTSGPGVAASGEKVWATALGGAYMAGDCGAIVSPAIDLGAASNASFSVKQWRHLEQSTSSTRTQFDTGMLFVSTDDGATWTRIADPTPAYDTGGASLTARNCLGQPLGTNGYSGPPGTTVPGPDYSTVGADLSAFAGQSVRVALAFAADGSIHRQGWYIDDFTVTIDDNTTVQDFEASEGGFTVQEWKPRVPFVTSWEWGTPANGPATSPNADGAMWGTDIDGNRLPNECGAIESPAIDLGGLLIDGHPANKATLRWQQWFRSSTGAGVVQVGVDGTYTNLVPTTGYAGSPSSLLDGCLQHVTQGSGAFQGTRNTPGGDMTDYEADISAFLGDVITLRFVFASSTSTSTFNQEGWYVDNVEVETFLYAGEPHTDGLPIPDPSGADAPLWTSGGESKSWAYGVVTDPSSNSDMIRGEVGYKTNLAGNSNLGECSWIASPAIPGAALASNPTLVFEHAYRIPGASVDVAWGGGLVQVSGDGGLTWDYLDLPEYDRPLDYSGGNPGCFTGHGAPLEGNVFSGVHNTQYETVTVDLSDYVGSPTVQVRFVFGTVVFAYEGWFIRDVQLGGADLLP